MLVLGPVFVWAFLLLVRNKILVNRGMWTFKEVLVDVWSNNHVRPFVFRTFRRSRQQAIQTLTHFFHI